MSNVRLRDKCELAETKNPEIYRSLLDLEARALSGPNGNVTYVWIDEFRRVTIGHGINWADCRAHCIRTSITDEGWMPGPWHFDPGMFVVVNGHRGHDIMRAMAQWVVREFGPQIINLGRDK